MCRIIWLAMALLILCQSGQMAAQDRKAKVLGDRETFAKNDLWVYNDLDHAFAAAKQQNKPLLVVFRCIPCEACSHFDQQLLAEQESMRELLDQFICVRVVQANGLDLELFQFDYDQSFHAMFLNADRAIYGRYGTRSQREEDDDMTMEGFRKAMQRVLELHKKYPEYKVPLAAKRGGKVAYAVPEQMPSLKGKYKSEIDYEGNVVASCIHCHQVRDAERIALRQADKPWPEQVLYPYPLPEVIGLTMDPRECATITGVEKDSIAARAGLKPGDQLLYLDEQPLVSTADLQWVLHNVEDEKSLAATVVRDRKLMQATLELPKAWRTKSNISWRASTWDLRRMASGGLWLQDLTDEQRQERDLSDDNLALLVRHAGEYGEHAVAKNAGFRKGDVLVDVDGRQERWSETQFLAFTLELPRGNKLPITVLRGKERVKLTLPLP